MTTKILPTVKRKSFYTKSLGLMLTLFLLFNFSVWSQDYNGTFTLNIQSYHDGHTHDHDKMSITYTFDGDRIAMLVGAKSGEATRMILDHNKKTMTALSEQKGNKSGVIMKMTDEMYEMAKSTYENKANEKYDDSNHKWEKTGKTKTIEGLEAYELMYESPEGKGTLWLTEEMGLHFASLMGIMKNNPHTHAGNSSYPSIYHEAFPLEINAQTPDGKDISKMWVTGISAEPDMSYFDTKGYEIQDMSDFDMQKYQNMQGR